MKKNSKLMAAFLVMSMAIPAHAEWPSNYDLELWPSNSKPLAELPAEICLTQKNTMSWSAVKIVSESGTGTITLTGPNGLNETLTVRSSDIGTYGDNEDYGIKITLPQAYTAEGTYTFSVPAGEFGWNWPVSRNAFDFSYEVKSGTSTDPDPGPGEVTGIPRNYTVNPDTGTYQAGQLGGQFTISFSSFQTVNDNYEAAAIEEGDYVTMSGPTGDKTYHVKSAVRKVTDPDTNVTTEYPNTHAIIFDVPAADFAVAGTYTMKANLLGMKTYPVNMGRDFSWQYVVEEAVAVPELKYNVSPAPGEVTEFPASIRITLPDADMVLPLNDRNPMAEITGPEGYSQKFSALNKELGNTVTITVNPLPTAPGEYTVTIPSDALTDSGDPFEGYADIKFAYTLKGATTPELQDADVTIVPAPGDVTEFPSEIKVTYKDQDFTFPLPDVNPCVTITGPNDYSQKFSALNTDYLADPSNTLTIKVEPVPTAPGEYTVTIPSSAIGNGNEESLDKFYNDVVFKYNLKEAETPVQTANFTVTPDPEAGLYEMFPKEIEVIFPDAKALMSNTGTVGATMKIECAANNISEEVTTDNFIMPNGYKFAIDKEYTLPGTYKCSIDFSDFKIYNQDMSTTNLSVIEFEYVIGGVTTRVEPAPGFVAKVSEINITVTNAQKVELAEDATITLKNAAGTDMPIETSVKDNVLTVKANPEITEAGEYTLAIAAGSLLIDGLAYDKAIYLDYSIKSNAIDAVFAGETSLDIYGIDGTVVVRKATRDDLRTLSKGIYVIGGKKVIVK